MLIDGVQLMIVGMGTVFAFLGLLVLMMYGSGKVVAALAPPPAAAVAVRISDEAEIAVVLAAVAAAVQAGKETAKQ